jgi:hypothetical protein
MNNEKSIKVMEQLCECGSILSVATDYNGKVYIVCRLCDNYWDLGSVKVGGIDVVIKRPNEWISVDEWKKRVHKEVLEQSQQEVDKEEKK